MKPPILMLLSRHPYAELSGRAFMLRQRIEQMRKDYDAHIVVLGQPAGNATDKGLTFVPLAKPASLAANTWRLRREPLQTWLYYSAPARAQIAALAEKLKPQAIYVDMLRLAPLAPAAKNAALIVDYDDVLSTRYRAAPAQGYDVMGFLGRRFPYLAPVARRFASVVLREEARRCQAYERATLKRADLVLFTSPREAEAMRLFTDTPVLGALPTITPRAAPATIGRRLIFLGNLRYAENVAMLREAVRGARALKAEGLLPDDAMIEAVGEHAPLLPGEFNPMFVRFLGRAPDLTVLEGAGIFLAPVVSGSGVKLKVLDGMALGCPVVTTPMGCEGLSVRANRDLIVAEDSIGVMRAAIALRDRTELKAMLARRGRAYLERAHSPAVDEALSAAIALAIAAKRQDTL